MNAGGGVVLTEFATANAVPLAAMTPAAARTTRTIRWRTVRAPWLVYLQGAPSDGPNAIGRWC